MTLSARRTSSSSSSSSLIRSTRSSTTSSSTLPRRAGGSAVDTFVRSPRSPLLSLSGGQQTGTMPALNEKNIKLNDGSTMEQFKQKLQWIWDHGGPGGQAAVNAFAATANQGKVNVNPLDPKTGASMQAGKVWGVPALWAPPFPATQEGQLRWASQFAHEMMHLATEKDVAGTQREVHAYLTEYNFYRDLGYSPAQIRTAMGEMNAGYLIGTMANVYGINVDTKAFVAFSREWLGVGGGSAWDDRWATVRFPETSSSTTLNVTGLTTQQLAEIAGNIQRGECDVRHLPDDPNLCDR